ncbi:MAG: hypothetical protein U9Q97_01110 [Acidobacteriota bacterium]|nr:hypothetical protein [Acidobacteriota bacterium]
MVKKKKKSKKKARHIGKYKPSSTLSFKVGSKKDWLSFGKKQWKRL